MTPGRRQRTKELFHSAVDLKPEERDAFLGDACGSDDQLRHEVERMLRHGFGEGLLDRPAWNGARLDSELTAGVQLGPYQIMEEIGAGGMGRVYRALDTRLGRTVAIKISSAEFSHRFQNEARAISALNHPHVCALHDIGEQDGIGYLVMEFVEGESLASRLSQGPLPFEEVLRYGVEIADALAAAHTLNIVHRDLKPANIMITGSGVKVLDFGLAEIHSGRAIEAPEIGRALVGTLAYMSPEQLEGRSTDARSDIFALGLVLYEMVARRRAFTGDRRTTLIEETSRVDPPPLPGAPTELSTLIGRCLQRDADKRVQHMDEVRHALQAQLIAREKAAVPPATSPQGSPPENPAANVTRKVLSRKTGPRAGVLALVGFLTMAAAAYYLQFRPRPRFARVEVLIPVNQGNVEMAVISPDGKLLVYAWDVNNQHTLTVRDLVSGEERVLTQGVFSRYYGLTFSRDGRSLYFTGKLPALASSLYRIPLLGGSPVRILEGIDSPVSFSPGDKRITFVREAGDSQLLVANADGTGQRQLLSRKLPEYVDYPAWSPDGKVIVASSMSGEGARLIRVEPDSGAERPAGNQVWDFLRYPVWLDGHTLVASVRPSRRASERLLLLSYPEGKAEALNLPGDRFITLSASLDGRSLAGVVRRPTASIWTADNSGELREIVAPVEGTRGIGWNGNGRLLFGPEGISSVKPDGTDLTRVLSGIQFAYFTVCGINRLMYTRSETPNTGLWRAALPGGAPRLLTANPNALRPQCSADGEWVLYSDRWSPAYQIPANGGAEQMLIPDTVLSPTVSPNNLWIAAYRSRRGASTALAPHEIAIYPRAGGTAVRTLPLRPGEFEWTPLRWTRDNLAIGYIERRGGVANLWLRPVDGGPPRQLTHFQGGQVIDFDWSPDGQLAVEFGTVVREIFLVRDKGK